MRSSGRYVDALRGFPPTGKPVRGLGAPLFLFDGPRLRRLGCLVTCSGSTQFSMQIRFQKETRGAGGDLLSPGACALVALNAAKGLLFALPDKQVLRHLRGRRGKRLREHGLPERERGNPRGRRSPHAEGSGRLYRALRRGQRTVGRCTHRASAARALGGPCRGRATRGCNNMPARAQQSRARAGRVRSPAYRFW